MSFKFNFDIEDADADLPESSRAPTRGTVERISAEVAPSGSDLQTTAKEADSQRCFSVTLDELLESLPPRISFSPLPLPFSSSTPLLRRELHDARFQLASTSSLPDPLAGQSEAGENGDGDGDGGEAYVSAGAGTDLIPGLYEGGLKTWEGGVDLVQVLSGLGGEAGVGEWVRGRRVMEVGCGTAMPTAYILSHLLAPSPSAPPLAPPPALGSSTPAQNTRFTRLLLQDYNLPVLTLVTLPNLLLAALPYLPLESLRGNDEEPAVESVLPDLNEPGELEITDEIKLAFKRLLEERGVELGFRYGAWRGLAQELRSQRDKEGDEEGSGGYGLVLSAETIYSEGSVDDLISVLRSSTAAVPGAVQGRQAGRSEGAEVQVELEDSLSGLQVRDEWGTTPLRESGNVVLIAAKVLYFGVGGGLQDFTSRIESSGGWVSTVQEWVQGVGRKVVRVGW